MFKSRVASAYFWKDKEGKTSAYQNYSYACLSPSILSRDEGEGEGGGIHEWFYAPTAYSRGRSIS